MFPMPPKSLLSNKRLNLDRFKNSGQGLVDFAVLIEQADPKNAEAILNAAMAEDPDFTQEALRKVVYFEEIIHLDETILAEILGKTSPKLLAFALHDRDEEFRKRIIYHLSLTDRRELLDEEEKMGSKIGKTFVLGAQKHILKTGRDLEAKGILSFEVLGCPRLAHKKKKA